MRPHLNNSINNHSFDMGGIVIHKADPSLLNNEWHQVSLWSDYGVIGHASTEALSHSFFPIIPFQLNKVAKLLDNE